MKCLIWFYCKKIEMLFLQSLEYSQVNNANTNEQCQDHQENIRQ